MTLGERSWAAFAREVRSCGAACVVGWPSAPSWLVLLVYGAFFGILWLWVAPGRADATARWHSAWRGCLLPAAGLCGGVLTAFRGSLHAVLVSGPLRGRWPTCCWTGGRHGPAKT